MQLAGPAHEIALSSAVAPPVAGTFMIDQVVPFQRSTSGVTEKLSTVSRATLPTAKHSVGDGHETPSSSVGPPAVGVETIFHDVPSHCWTSAPWSPPTPTAKHVVGVAQATAPSSPLGGPGGLSLPTSLQRGVAAATLAAGVCPGAALVALSNPPAISATATMTRGIARRPRTRD